jgi:hypothetical protein
MPIEVRKEKAVVGREPSGDVVVADGSVSRKHAHLEWRGDTWYVVDQGSANGTFLDSQRISESALRTGQELRFGAVSYRVEIEGGPDAPTDATIPPEAGATMITSSPLPPRPVPPPPPPPPPPPAPSSGPPRVSSPPPSASAPGAPPRPGAPAYSMPPPPAPRQGKSPVFWMGLGCCGCLMLVIIGFFTVFGAAYCGTMAPAAAVRTQLQQIDANQLDAAYAGLSSSYKASLSPAAFEALVNTHPALHHNKDATFRSRETVNQTARLGGTLTAKTGETEAVAYELIKEDGAWKISSIQFAGDVSGPTSGLPRDAGTSRDTGSGRENGPADGGRDRGTSTSTSAAGQLDVQTLGVEKKPQSSGTVVYEILLNVTGVTTRASQGRRQAHVALDVDAVDPSGRRVLTKKSLKEVEGLTSNVIETAQFTATLTLPPSLEAGTYVAHFTVRDVVGHTALNHDVRFEFP